MLPSAVTAITLALIFYTTGVFWERHDGKLNWKHLLFFLLGLTCDTIGTSLMFGLAGNKFTLDLHGITGVLAIVLMLIHAAWALIVLITRNEKAALSFHKFSIVVWAIWLVPYILGMILNMAK